MDHEVKTRKKVESMFKTNSTIQDVDELRKVYDDWMNESDEDRSARLLKYPAEKYDDSLDDYSSDSFREDLEAFFRMMQQ